MAINNVRHPIKDTVKADNSTYSSNKIESLIHSATELPETSIEDAGDVLIVNNEGKWAKGDIIIPQEVPTPAVADIGKVVSVVSDGESGAEYGLEDAPSSDPFIIEVDLNDQDEYILVEGTSLTDIRNAINSKSSLAVMDISGNANILHPFTGSRPNNTITEGIDLDFMNTYIDASRKIYLSAFQLTMSMDPTINTTILRDFYKTWTSS